MARAIWKYPLTLTAFQKVDMPAGAKSLHVDVQAGTICLWALVDPHIGTITKHIIVVGTGHPAPSEDEATYIGSVPTDGGAFVWHVFEQKPPPAPLPQPPFRKG